MLKDEPLVLQQGYVEPKGEKFIPQGEHKEVIPVEKAEPLKEVCDSFLESVRTNIVCKFSSGIVATKLVQILTSLSRSMEENGAIVTISDLDFSGE